MATVITKESDSIITTTDGVVTNVQSIRREDNVISVAPSASYGEVFNIVRDISTGFIIVYYDSSSVEIDPSGGMTGAEIVALLEALGAGSRLSHTKLDDVGTSDHHTRYTDVEAVIAAKDALDYGLSFEGIVTTATDATHFKVSTLAGKGAGFFIPNAGDAYEIYVVQADGAAPEGLHTSVLAYDTSDGDFTHADFVTGDLEVGDIVLVMHPWLAFIKDVLTDTADMQPKLGTPADTNLATDIANVQVVVDALENLSAANVATELETYDGVKRSEATSDKDAVIAAIPAMVGTDNAALASVLEDAMQKASPNYNQDTDSLEALRELLDTIAGDVANVDGSSIPAMVGTNNAATEAKQNTMQTAIDAIPTASEIQTEMEADGASLLDTIRDELANGSDGLTALKTAIDAISAGYTHTDWKGSFNWDTSVNTTSETDISTLFSTDLAIATRRKYSVKLDLTTVEADGSFVSCYIAVKEKIDGTNYRAIDRKLVEKADISAVAEPGIIIDIPATSENIQITMQMTTATAGDCTIYYAVVLEALE